MVIELRCTADFESKRGGATANRKVKGTIHWVSAAHAVDAEVRLYDRLFTVPEPDAAGDFKQFLNPHSLEVVTAKCEPSLERGPAGAALSVRAARLFLSGPGSPAVHRPGSGFQPHDHAQGYLGSRRADAGSRASGQPIVTRRLGIMTATVLTEWP